MSDAIATPSSATLVRRFVARIWDDPDWRSTTIGLAGVTIIYLLLVLGLFVAQRLIPPEPASSMLHARLTPRQFNIEISPEMLAPPVKPQVQPKQFVETNPDAPENTPDKTNNFAAQNQQVAQEKPTPDGTSERPAMEGKKDFQSTQIVSGRLEKQIEHFETAPQPTVQTQRSQAMPRAEQNPLPGFEKKMGENPDGFGSANSTAQENVRQIPERVEGAKNVPLIEGAIGMEPAIDPKHPRPRPSIVKQQQVRPAILADNKFGTQNVGITAINAKFSNYGAYLQRLVEAVQLEWDSLLDSSQTFPPSGTFVVVHFFINSDGKVVRFGDVDNHSSTWGSQACTAAITNRAPYGVWTDDMKAALNPEGEELVFTFYYQ